MSEPRDVIVGPAPDLDGPLVCTLPAADFDSLTDCSCGLAGRLPG